MRETGGIRIVFVKCCGLVNGVGFSRVFLGSFSRFSGCFLCFIRFSKVFGFPF